MEKKFDKVLYNNTFNSKSYDRLNIMVQKGKKEVIKAHAVQKGESLNSFVNRAINETMEKDKA